ncbi:Serine/threonine protein kinase [Handroanthus impetiginosus]|uniref:non-specific serine/threonine protein kinase n=1 Tax=Handroanthus impetiginosus TaxID=429701 RepID=A0A2G9HMP1_9LAMI|nr:Serine/threonine protein kinase [Handroanthus impetiginosus]
MDFLGNFKITAIHFIIMLLLASLQILLSSPLSIATDKEALISFKSQISVELPNNPLTTWDQNFSPCNWTGVSCHKLGRRVVGLKLSGLRITGSISPYLGNLSFLTSLELQNNQLSGKIPDQLGNLFHLKTLNLSFNSIEGVIPSHISRCKDLRSLDLMQNQLSGRIPEKISQLEELQLLNLARNQLSGDFPSSLTNISSLVNLNIGTNSLSGAIPSEISRLVNLRFLDLTINNLSGEVPLSIYNMSSLVYLALASNNLWGELPGDIGIKLPNLLGLNFCFNKFTGKIPWSLHNLTNIKTIRLAHNLLHGNLPPGLGNLPNLEMYNIGFNSIVSSGQRGLDFLELLTNSTSLNFLAIDFNLLEGAIPKSIGNLSKVLTKFYMGGNDIYGIMPSSIGELKALELLNLSYSSLSGEIPKEIGSLQELRVLALANNMLSGELPDSLGNLRLLTKIDLSKNKLVGRIPKTYGNLKSLISMDLSDNMLNASIPAELINLPRLSAFLNLSQNQLTGPLPSEIGLLENVAVINISDNRLSGNIPESIGRCKSLEKLSLSRNTLSGLTPDTLGSLKGLEVLDLSSNQLSGPIPSDLTNLQSLQILNLSFNNLEGKIPTGGIFSDPSKSVDLERNRNLCSGLSCNTSRRRKLTSLSIIIIVITAVITLCFSVGLICYVMKRKGMMIKNSFDQSVKGQPQMISYKELRLATDNFNQENLIGRGSFGFVYKGFVLGAAMAVKVLDTAITKSRKTFLAECEALRNVRHRNLIKLITVCSSINSKNEEFLALIFEYMSNGSLDDWIGGKRRHENGMKLNVFERLRCVIGIASAIHYLHNEREVQIVHCDLKPSNVLLDSDMTPKVADFGLAKLLRDSNNEVSASSTHALRGSIGYIPPEYGYGEKPSTAGDVYSYGILLLELFTGKSPTYEIFKGGLSLKSWVQDQFPTNLEQVLDIELLQQMMNDSRDDDDEYCSKPLRDCLITIFGVGLSCTAESPDKRITIIDALWKLKNVEKIFQKHEFHRDW